MKYSKIFLFLATLSLMACDRTPDLAEYVDPLIGTDAHGHVYPGAATPFGMVQLSPDTRKDSWDGCSGYHYSDSTIMGFSHTHLSGTGVGDYGDIRFMPTVGEIQLDPGTEADPESGYRSRFSHDLEEATAGFYEVELEDYDIEVELTCTPRAGFHEYEFPETDQANVIIDLTEGVTSDIILNLWIEVVSDTEIQGMRQTQGWSKNQYVFFNAEFSKPFKEYGISLDGNSVDAAGRISGKDVKAWVRFDTDDDEDVLVKVGISAVNAEGAKNNREKEIPHWDFEKIATQAREAWNNELARIEIDDPDDDSKTVFYTALYHALLAPNLYSDVDGKYRGHDNNIHQTDGFDMYTVFSLWDTFRAAHPLFTLIDQKRTNDFINTMIKQYEQGGLLPVWELAANETNCMIGYHSVPVIVDAYMKGIRGYDVERALDACIKSAMQDQFGLDSYKRKGYIPSDEESESVSKTLEYAYDDWCIAMLADKLGRVDDYEQFIKRAQYYKNIYDPESGFMRAKANETWFSPFDPSEVNFNYTEANSWQYSFFVPQDVSGLMNLLGGPDKMVNRLDELFSVSSETTGRHQSDITGLIGQYAHGNEPSHHMAYLYNYAGQPWKTQEVVKKIINELYTSMPDGLCGNEDCGQMSAWYVLSAMGFYPVTPGSNIYAIGSPVFEEVILNFENGNEFEIEAENLSIDNIYIQSATLNGEEYTKSFITHSTLMAGGELVLEMGDQPNKDWGTQRGDFPVSEITEHLITPVPFVKTGDKVFFDGQIVELGCADAGAQIRYVHDEKTGKVPFQLYEGPIQVTETSTVFAFAKSKNKENSHEVDALFLKIPKGRKITIKNTYANQYNAGGDLALIDYQRGGNNFRTGNWQGYEGVNLEAVIELEKSTVVSKLSTGFLQDINAWIFMPKWVEYSVSSDGKYFTKLGTVKNTIAEDDWDEQAQDFTLKFKPQPVRYIKVIAKNRGICPEGHKGAGNAAWIFADEVVIE